MSEGVKVENWGLEPRPGKTKLPFVRITYDGANCIARPGEVNDLLDGRPASDYEFEEVWMTEAQYQALPDFTGW